MKQRGRLVMLRLLREVERLVTAKLNGLYPAVWLKDTLNQLPAWPNRRLDELLPLRRDQKIS